MKITHSPSYQVIARGLVDDPTVSGDGQVFAWTRRAPSISEIEVQRRGEEPQLLTDDTFADKNPVLNHDGSVCAWERYDKEGTRSWDVARQGPEDSEPQIVGAGPGPDWDVDISDSGDEIVWGRFSENYRERTAMVWKEGQGEMGLTAPPVMSALPKISDDGQRIFFMQLAPASSTNQIWMREADGYEKPILYETDPYSRNNRKRFATTSDGSHLAWVEKEGAAPAKLFRWQVNTGRPELITEAPLIGGIDISDDARTMTWTENGQVKVYQDGKIRQLTEDVEGLNATPKLSDDGKTLVWLWRNPKYLHPNEVRSVDLN